MLLSGAGPLGYQQGRPVRGHPSRSRFPCFLEPSTHTRAHTESGLVVCSRDAQRLSLGEAAVPGRLLAELGGGRAVPLQSPASPWGWFQVSPS